MYIPRHQKTYLSRAMTRAMALDHPIGDPHGGPAYGERNDPVSAIISIGTMLFTGAEVIAGTATLMQGLMFAGSAISLVGNITGNKTLSKIGMITGLAGGVGALAESAGMFASGTLGETFGYGVNSATTPLGFEDIGALNQTPNAQVPQSVDVVDSALAAPVGGQPTLATEPLQNLSANFDPGAVQVVDGPPPLINSAAPGLQSPSAANMPLGFENAGALQGAPAVPGAPGAPAAPGAPGAPTVPGGDIPATPEMVKIASSSTDPIGSLAQQMGQPIDPSYAPNIRPMTSGEQLWQNVKDAGSGVMNFAKANPGAGYMLGSAISSVADVLSGKTGAQINALEAQGELSKAQADKLRYEVELTKRRHANLNAGYVNVQNPLATWTPNFQVTPAAQPGLITGAMAPTPGG